MIIQIGARQRVCKNGRLFLHILKSKYPIVNGGWNNAGDWVQLHMWLHFLISPFFDNFSQNNWHIHIANWIAINCYRNSMQWNNLDFTVNIFSGGIGFFFTNSTDISNHKKDIFWQKSRKLSLCPKLFSQFYHLYKTETTVQIVTCKNFFLCD